MIQRMFVTLDTKKTNYKNVGKINHGDDLIIELTVLSDGNMISFNDPMVDLLVKKSDGKMIRQNSGIEHVKPNKFIIEVSKDCVTSPGLSTNQLIINDNGRISTCMFYYTILNSLEEDIIQSISSVEVLEQLDEYVIEAHERMELLNNDINELEELFGDTSDNLVEAERARNEAEQNRVQSEILRVNNENDRIEADNIRNQNDYIRNQNEVDRTSSELVREQRESERILNEEERRQNESERMMDESTRQQNENTRQSNESIRMSNEIDRKTQENRRVTAETNRANAETTRRNNENSRISNEIDRKTQENRRVTAETNRVNAETTRLNNENSRISNEIERQKTIEEMKSLMDNVNGFDERIRVIEDEIEEVNSSLDNLESEVNELKEVKEGNVNIDLTDYATKTELSLKVDKVTGKSLISDSEIERLSTLENYDDSNIKNTLNSKADKSELHSHTNKTVLDGITTSKISEWNNKSTFSGNYNDLTNKPTIPTKTSQLTNDSGFITSIPSEYVTETELNNKGYLTQHQDISHKADKSELHSHTNKTVLDGITTSKISEWNNKSTFSGNYNDLTNKPTIPTKTSQLTNDSGFITSIPSEYVTESELNNKGYLTQHQDLSNYATKTQVNAFDTLTLGINKNDGLMYIYKQGVPMGSGVELGVKGDVIGYIDSDNSIILSGVLAKDTYNVKYETEDGTLLDIGVLKNSDEPVITFTNQIPLSIGSDGKPFNGGQGWKTGYRLSGSSGGESALSDIEVTGFIPCKMGDTIYIKGIIDDGSHVMGIYDSSFGTVATVTIKEKLTLNGSVVSVTIDSKFASTKDETNTAYFRISANTIDNNSIITVNQPLT